MIQIKKTIPKNLEKSFPLDKNIEIVFVLDVEKETITNKTVFLTDLEDQKVIKCDLVYSNKILKICPEETLKSNCHYQYTILGEKEGIKFINNSYLSKTYNYEFFTQENLDVKAPEIIYPNQYEEINENKIKIEFLKVKEAKYYLIQVSKSNTFDVSELSENSIKVYNVISNNVNKITYKLNKEFNNNIYYLRVMSVGEVDYFNQQTNKLEKKETYSEWSKTIQFKINSEEVVEGSSVTVETENLSGFFDIGVVTGKLNIEENLIVETIPDRNSTHIDPTSIKEISLVFSSKIKTDSEVKKIYLIEEKN